MLKKLLIPNQPLQGIINIQNMQTKDLKVMVVGPRCGKSTFIKNITNLNSNFVNSNTTLGIDVTLLDLHTNNGKRRLNFWEVGSEFKGLKNEYCIGAELAIIFKKNNNTEHIEFENWLPIDIPKLYVNDYNNMENQNIINNIKSLIVENNL